MNLVDMASGIMNAVYPKKRTVVAILAVSLDLTIGIDNDIPWNCSTDMQFFKRATTGNVVIMGRKTFESMNSKPLPNRVNIVISTSLKESDVPDSVIVVRDFFAALKQARHESLDHLKRNTIDEHIFVIGGVQIYSGLINICDEALVSSIAVSCGANGYGSEFYINKLCTRFIDSDIMSGEVIYYNNNAIESKDKDELREIIHYTKIEASHTLTFKQD